MKYTTTFSLGKLTKYKENARLEVKSAKGGLPNSLWESYSAFANSEGGVIVLGAKEKEDGTIFVEGLKDVHKLIKDFWNTLNNRQKVSSNILTDSMAYPDKFDGKDVIVIHVPRAERTTRPVYVGADPRTGTFRRNFEGDYHCTLEEVSLMIRDSALVTDDNRLLTEFDVSVFCPDTVKAYRNIFKLIRPHHLWNQEDDALFLRRIGAVREDKDTGRFHPTAAGLLMLGYEYDISSVFPNYFLDYQENRTNGIYARWTDRLTSQSGDWSGNVFDFILRVIPKLQSDLKVPFMFKGNLRNDDTPLHKTVREATVNMLANADFYGRRGVVVHKDTNGFKFANPGSMRVSLHEALQDSASDPRNGVMMKMLAMVEYGERAGSGLQGIFNTWRRVYHCDPRLESSSSGGVDRTTLILDFNDNQPDIAAMAQLYGDTENQWEAGEPQKSVREQEEDKHGSAETDLLVAHEPAAYITRKPKYMQEKLQSMKSNKEKILYILSGNPGMTLDDVAGIIGMSRIGVQKIVGKLKEEGVLTRIGSNKKGEWVVI